eukprot:1407072-Amphidinium_carterae.1
MNADKALLMGVLSLERGLLHKTPLCSRKRLVSMSWDVTLNVDKGGISGQKGLVFTKEGRLLTICLLLQT